MFIEPKNFKVTEEVLIEMENGNDFEHTRTKHRAISFEHV